MLSRAVTGPLVRRICTNPSSHSSRLAMGGLVPRVSKRSSSTLGEYRKLTQTLFCKPGQCPIARYRSLRIAPVSRLPRPRSPTKSASTRSVLHCSHGSRRLALLAAAFLSRSPTKDVSARSLVQDSGAPAWLGTAARHPASSRTVGLGSDDRQQVLAIPVYLRRPKALHLHQLPHAAGARLGNGDQRGIGEDTVRG
jgi:hypothetical protein